MSNGRSSRLGALAALALVLGIALPLRLVGRDFGPDLVHARPDELGVVDALRFLRHGKVHPMLLAYGGGYHVPLYAFVRGTAAVAGADPLAVEGTEAFHRIKMDARLWSALVSALAVALTFVAGRRFADTPTGFLAALFVALTVLPVREAHFAKADGAALCASALVLATLLPVDRRGPRTAAALGAALAWVVSTKYLIGILPAGMWALVRMTRRRPSGWDTRALAAAVAAALPVLLLCNLHWLLAPGTSWLFLQVILQSQAEYTRLPFLTGQAPGPLAYHTLVSLRHGSGLMFALLVPVALLRGLRSRGGRLVLLVIAGNAFVLSLNHLVVARNALPLWPALAVLIADLVVQATSRLPPTWRRWALGVASAMLFVEPIANDVRLLRALTTQDTRSEAAVWIDALPPEARIVRWGAPPGATPYGAPDTGGRVTMDGPAPERWRALRVTHVVWDAYPLPFSGAPLPAEARGRLKSLVVFDPGMEAGRGVALEPHDAFYLPLAGPSGATRPGPRIEIFAVTDGAGSVRPR